jgi:hypothetical protein
MANTFELIASSTVGAGGSSSISFSSISGTYTDLCVKLSLRMSASALTNNIQMTFNTLTTNQSKKMVYGDGSAAASENSTRVSFDACGNNSTSNTFSNHEVYIPNYANSSYNKSLSIDSVQESNGTEAYAELIAGLWSSTSAITALGFASNNGANFLQYSTAYLYGVKNA